MYQVSNHQINLKITAHYTYKNTTNAACHMIKSDRNGTVWSLISPYPKTADTLGLTACMVRSKALNGF